MRTYRPLEWPYKAKAARDGAAEAVQAAERLIEPLADTETDTEKLRRLTRTITLLLTALRLLEGAGAPTRPPAP
jgi:hypothetical protein